MVSLVHITTEVVRPNTEKKSLKKGGKTQGDSKMSQVDICSICLFDVRKLFVFAFSVISERKNQLSS